MGDWTSLNDRQVVEARDAISQKRFLQPSVAIILGSGLGPLADTVDHQTTIPYSEIPHFPLTRAAGHAGRLVLGFLGGLPVVVMQGRCHRYEGCANSEVQFPVQVMHALGATTLIATNAAGGLNANFKKGDLMMLDSHIDLLWQRGNRSPVHEPPDLPAFHAISPYDASLASRALRFANQRKFRLHQGCYLATLGPTYETRSEYKAFRWMGADAVGMSTIPEVVQANRLSMQVAAFSVITNVAETEEIAETSHEDVVATGNQVGPQLQQLITDVLEDLSGQPD